MRVSINQFEFPTTFLASLLLLAVLAPAVHAQETSIELPEELIKKDSTLTPEEQDNIDRYVNYWAERLRGIGEEEARLLTSGVASGQSAKDVIEEKSEELSRNARNALVKPLSEDEPSTFFRIAYTRTMAAGVARYKALESNILVVRLNALMTLAWGGDTQALKLAIFQLDQINEKNPACRYWAAKALRNMISTVDEEIIYGAADVEVRIATEANVLRQVKNALNNESHALPRGEMAKLLFAIGGSDAFTSLFTWLNTRLDQAVDQLPDTFESENALLREIRLKTKSSWDIPPATVPDAIKSMCRLMSAGAILGSQLNKYRTESGNAPADHYYREALELLENTDNILRKGLVTKLKIEGQFPASYARQLRRSQINWTEVELLVEQVKSKIATDKNLGLTVTDLSVSNLKIDAIFEAKEN